MDSFEKRFFIPPWSGNKLVNLLLKLQNNPHPNIVQMKSLSVENEVVVQFEILTPLQTLFPLSEERKISIAYDIANAVLFLISKKMLDVNMHPRNILVSEDGTAKLGGLYYPISSMTRIDDQKTFKMIPPELLEKPCDWTEKSTVFMFGCFLAYLFTERSLFPDEGIMDVLSHVSHGLRPVLPHNLHEGIKDLIHMCWRHDPEERPTMTDVCDYLKEY